MHLATFKEPQRKVGGGRKKGVVADERGVRGREGARPPKKKTQQLKRKKKDQAQRQQDQRTSKGEGKRSSGGEKGGRGRVQQAARSLKQRKGKGGLWGGATRSSSSSKTGAKCICAHASALLRAAFILSHASIWEAREVFQGG